MSIFWNFWIIGLTVICLALVTWVLFANRKVALRDDQDPENRTTGHIYDGIEEYDNPLPKWWFQLFVATLIFAVLYLLYYPGLGSWRGLGGWTQVGELARDQEAAQEENAEAFANYLATPIEELIHDSAAMKMGIRLFSTECSVCHGSDGGGNYGFPDLTDNDWLYGGTPERIKETITHGRTGNMPAWGAILGESSVAALTEYVLRLSNLPHDAALATRAEPFFTQRCAACHGADGTGNQVLGAPDLTNNIWLYDDSRDSIAHTIRNGRVNLMPSQGDKLKEEKIHLLAAYVYGLSFGSD